MDKEKKEKRKKVVEVLKKWGAGNALVREKTDEYKSIQNLYEVGKKSELVSDAELFGYKSLAEQVFRDVRKYLYEKSKIEQMLDRLDSVERSVIVCRYAKKIKWDVLPAYLPINVSIRQCYRIHKEALEKLAGFMEEENM